MKSKRAGTRLVVTAGRRGEKKGEEQVEVRRRRKRGRHLTEGNGDVQLCLSTFWVSGTLAIGP